MTDQVLRDRDFELEVHLDANSDSSRAVKEMMDIPEAYYTSIVYDPPDQQIKLYFDALRGLTPRGRGERSSPEDLAEEPDGEFF